MNLRIAGRMHCPQLWMAGKEAEIAAAAEAAGPEGLALEAVGTGGQLLLEFSTEQIIPDSIFRPLPPDAGRRMSACPVTRR